MASGRAAGGPGRDRLGPRQHSLAPSIDMGGQAWGAGGGRRLAAGRMRPHFRAALGHVRPPPPPPLPPAPTFAGLVQHGAPPAGPLPAARSHGDGWMAYARVRSGGDAAPAWARPASAGGGRGAPGVKSRARRSSRFILFYFFRPARRDGTNPNPTHAPATPPTTARAATSRATARMVGGGRRKGAEGGEGGDAEGETAV